MATNVYSLDAKLTPAGYQQITDLSSAEALPSLPSTGVVLVLVQAESQDIRWRDDGTDPTASVGMVIEAGQTLAYTGNPAVLKLIEAAASAKANISYYKR
jgi:hypothetical protein